MTIQLDYFEQQIDPAILRRGYDYFKKGHITSVDNLGGGDYEATIDGSETYTIRLHVRGNEVTDYECDCPYDGGPVCKHIVAFLFYLQKDLLERGGLLQDTTYSKPQKEPETAQFKKLLNQLSIKELRDFIDEVCSTEKSLRRLFIVRNISHLYPESRELYSRLVRKLVEAYVDRHGFIDSQESSKLGNAVYKMLEEAKRWTEDGKKQKTLYMTEVIIEEVFTSIENADDSNGVIGRCLTDAFGVLSELAGSDLDKALHDELFGWLLYHFEANTMKGWNWHNDLMRIAIAMVKTEDEKERIRTDLELIKPSGKEWDWSYRVAQDLMLQLIRRTENEGTVMCFTEANKTNPDFRKALIEKAMRRKDYDEAERLASEGVEKDKKDSPRLAEDWRYYLLQIYQAVHDTEKATGLARHFFVNGENRYQPCEFYYKLLKSHIPQAQWGKYVDDLIADINGRSCWGMNYDRVAEIYIMEEQWDKLLELLREYSDFYRIEKAEKYLADEHAEELVTMYRELIVRYMPNNVGRGHYRMVCKYIRRMMKLGYKPLVMEFVDQLKNQYHNRRALLEELERI